MSKRSLRVAFIGARGVVGTYSGIETYYEEVGSRLVERGHQVTAYCRTYFTPDIATYRGIRVRRLPSLRAKHFETISHSVLATLDTLFRDYDVIQYHAIGSAPLAFVPRLFGRKTVVSVRGLDWQRAKWGWVAEKVLKFGEWASASCPTATVVVSKELQRHYSERRRKRPFHVPNAVVAGNRRPIDGLREHGLEPDSFLLFVGRLSPEKGVHTLLSALRPLSRNKRLVLAGGASYTDSYVRQIEAESWDEVLFLGRVGRETMEELYSNCYAFILPSTMEGLSVALLEALSYGCCIVTTDIPENVEVVGSAGLTFPVGDTEALRELMEQVLETPETVEEYRARASERAAFWPDWDDVARLTEEIYLRLMTGQSSSACRDGAFDAMHR